MLSYDYCEEEDLIRASLAVDGYFSHSKSIVLV